MAEPIPIFKSFLRLVADPSNAQIDIVAVHGLNPFNKPDHGENTWRGRKSGKSWLREFLPQEVPSARIFIFGYNSSVAFSSGNEGVHEQANTICFTLGGYRQDAPNRPIIFICRSLGGLIAMILCRMNHIYAPISNATYGFVFFGTPHRGGNNVRPGEVIASIARRVLGRPPNDYLNILRHDSFLAEELRKDFKPLQDNFHVLTFFETLPKGKAGMIVDRESAELGLSAEKETVLGIEADHDNICKFESQNDEKYKKVSPAIYRLIHKAIDSSAMPAKVSPLDNNATFPSTDLINQISPYYVDREGLTQALDRMFVQGENTQEGPKVVLVYGQAGFGKTQLVRHFAKKQLGYDIIFRWLDASDLGKLKKSLLDLAEEAGLIPEGSAKEPTDSWSEKSIQKTLKFVGALQHRWLLIYDNFDVSENESTLLRNYFPGGSLGQIIVTNRSRSVAAHIDAKCLHVESLTDSEAVELLGKSSKIDPRETGSQARDLQRQIAAKLLGCHPLSIAQAGAYILINISQHKLGVEERLQEYRRLFGAREREMLNAQNGSLVRDYGRSVIASWDLSFQKLLDMNPTAGKLFLFLGFLHHANIPQDLFAIAHEFRREIQKQDAVTLEDKSYSWVLAILADEDGSDCDWDASNLGICMDLLESYSLVRITQGPQYSIHPLVHDWTRLGNVASTEDLEANAHLALVFLSYVSLVDFHRSPRAKAVHLKFISHVESCIRFAQKQTTLLKLHGVQPQPKLRARCLLALNNLLDGQGFNWEMKVQQVSANLAVLATVSGSVHDALDSPSTLRAICLVLREITKYPSCADVAPEISVAMLSVTPSLSSCNDRGNRAEIHFQILYQVAIALVHTTTPAEIDDTEMRALKWADDHRDEMDLSFYLSRKVGLMSVWALCGHDKAERLVRLKRFRRELEVELGEQSNSTWSIRLAIAQCLIKMGKTSEAVSIIKCILDRCPTLESDMRYVINGARHLLSTIFTHDKSYSDLVSLKESLEEAKAEELGPYHEDTLQEKNHKIFYENKLKPYEESHEFPYMLSFNTIFLKTDPGACLEESDVSILETALSCKASGRDSEIEPLWNGVIDQSKLMPNSESLFQSFTLALETAAAAGDRQGYHSLSSSLRKDSDTLKARKLASGPREPKVKTLRRLRDAWNHLTSLHRAANTATTPDVASKCVSITESIYSDVRDAPVKAQPIMLWLISHYTMWFFQLSALRRTSPVPFSFLENLLKPTLKHFGAESVMTYLIRATLALCYRHFGQEELALQLENDLITKRIQESINQSRVILYRRQKAALAMERLVNAYRRRQWYTETVRLFEIVIEAFKEYFGMAAEETMLYVRWAFELYGRLGLEGKIDAILEQNMLRVFRQDGNEQKEHLIDQIISAVKWCLQTEQIAAAHRVLLWLTVNGNLGISTKISCFKDLEDFAGRLGEHGWVKKYSEQRSAYERQSDALGKAT